MTREEAISVLKEIIDESWIFSDVEKAPTIDACEMAISALSENKGDLISRQAVLDSLKEHRALYCDNTPETFSKLSYAEKSRVDELDTAIATIINLPSVENKGEDRPKGRWIGHREHCENLGLMPSGLGAYEWCSNCDCGIDVREWHRNNYNYCPNCGADMRGET